MKYVIDQHGILVLLMLTSAVNNSNETESGPVIVSGGGGQLARKSEYTACGDCHCIPGAGMECPTNMPRTDYTSLITKLRNVIWENPMTIDCDPYNDEGCDTSPSLVEGGACVVDFSMSVESFPEQLYFTTTTYAGTAQQALKEGKYVTHEGACGTCSSLQDLAAYMEQGPGLRARSTRCAFVAIVSKPLAIQCFLDLGFTDACATVWYHNTRNTRRDCSCVSFVLSGNPPNGPAPECSLAECLLCDEVKSGPMFKKFAGRSRRNSGLLSNIARPCNELVKLDHVDPYELVSFSIK